MTFEEILDQALGMLQRRGRVTYRTLRRQFQLDDDVFEDLKAEIIRGQRLAVDEDGEVLVWTGDAPWTPAPAAPVPVQGHAPRAYTPDHLTEKILASRAALEGERKQVTVLFADLKGSMELLADRDPEEARHLLDPVLERMIAAVHQYEGTVNQVMGDGIMALFGAPIAHEDHAVRACYAALRMQETVTQYGDEVQRSHGIPIQMRVGLNSGAVVVRAIGNDLHMDYSAIGQTTHLAARMEQVATPGSIRLTAATLRLVEGLVRVNPLGPVPVKGLAEAVEVFELVGASAVRGRLQAGAARGLTRFVGRETEIAALAQALARAGEGHGQVVAAVGEAGVGKSRLLYEFIHSPRTKGWRVVEAAAVSYGKATPYVPVVDLLKRYLHIEDGDEPRTVRANVTGHLLTLDETLQETIPALLALLDALPADSPFLTLDPPQRRQRTLAALKRVLLCECQVQPLLLVFEDLHWIDSETQALLDSLVESLPTACILLLVNYRPEYQHGWVHKTYYTQLRIDPLPPAGADEFLQALLGHDPGLAPLTPLLIARTEGNPFFLEESVRTLAETAVLVGERGAYRLAKPLDNLQVPATVQAVLAARIDRLPAEEKHLLQTAAVIGTEVPLPLLQAIAERPEVVLHGGLTHLQAAEFLYEMRLFPEHEYTFTHALTHEVAYGSLLLERRRVLHARVVEALEALAGEQVVEQVEHLAHHALRGELWSQAVAYCQQAGEKALARSAHREAVGYFEQALHALPHLPERHETIEQAIDLRLALRSALRPLGNSGRILAVLREAEALAVALDDPRRLGQVSRFLSLHFSQGGAYDQAIAAAQRALTLATAGGEVALHALANYHLGVAYHAQGDYRRAIDALRGAVAFFEGVRGHERFGQAILPAVLSRAFLAWCHAELGSFAEGIALGDEGLRIAEAVDHPGSLMWAWWAIGLLALRQGDLSRALPRLERAVGICQDTDLPVYVPWVTAALGAAYTLGGRVSDAVPLLTQVVEQTTGMETVAYQVLYSLSLGEAQVLAGRLEEAHALVDRTLALARERQERGHQVYALRLLGEIAVHRDPPEGELVEAHYHQALALAEELGMRPLVAHCRRGLGTLYVKVGRREQAHAELFTAIDLYRAMDMTFWLPQAEAALAQVGGAVMDYDAILAQVVALLQREQRLSYRVLKLRLQLDDDTLEALKEDLIYAKQLARDEDGRVLVWAGDAGIGATLAAPAAEPARPPRSYTPPYLAEKILTSKATLEGERKQVTVLFADLKGSMELLAGRDPEEARAILDPVLERMMAAVHRYEGTVNQVMGDGIMALFGAPIAHEDHAVRACYAALAMQAAVKRYAAEVQRTKGVPLHMRVGLNSGKVVVRAVGSDLRMDYSAIGQTTHLAARMEQMAMPGTMLLTAETLQLVEGLVQVTALGPLPVKGLAEPVVVYELVGATAVRRRLQASVARGLTRFIGRQTELDALRQALERAGRGQGQLVAVVGEPGVGKSRLVYEFLHSYQTQGWRVLESASVSYGKATPYFPVVDLLKRYVHVEDADEPRTVRAKVTGQVLTLDETLQEMIPALLWLLDVLPEDSPFRTLEPPQRRQRTLEAVKRVLLRESQAQPLLLVFEDLHWIDTETQALLDSLVESLPAARLLLLVNYRPEYQHGWGSKTYYTQLRLDPLPPASADELLQSLLGNDPRLALLSRLLIERTEGNPFFLEESVRTLIETHVLVGERGAYRVAQALPTIQVPATVQAVLAARMDRLPAEDKRLLQTAAVIGTEVPGPLLQAIADTSDEALYRSLAQLQAAEFLYETRLFPEHEYTFKHALTHEVAYSGLLQERRRVLHACIVEALEILAGNRVAEQVELLASHALRGEVWAKALVYGRQAGEKALARSAHREAVGYFEQALSALPHLPAQHDTRQQAIDLRLALSSALQPWSDWERIIAYLRETEALAAALDDPRRLGQVAIRLSRHFYFSGAYDQSIAAGQRALALATVDGDVVLQAQANQRLGLPYGTQGDYRRAIDCLRQSVAFFEGARARERFGQFFLPAVLSHAHLAWWDAELGLFAEGRAFGDEGLRVAEAVAHLGSLMIASWGMGLLALRQGDLPRALPLLERAIGICQDADLQAHFPRVAAALGAAYTLDGRVADAVPLLTQAMEQTTATELVVFQALCGLPLAEAQLLAGRLEEAHALAEHTLALTHKHHERGNQAYALCLLGEIAVRREPPESDQAGNYYHQALTLADELGMRPLQAHCHRGLGTLYAEIGWRELAHDELSTAIELYRAMEMTFWLPQAEVALAQVEGQ